MKAPKPLLIILGILAIIALYFNLKGPDKSYFADYDFFNESEIKGRITYVGIKYHQAYFKIDNGTAGYVFSPITDEILNGANVFTNFAKTGDSIIKDKHSDTLILKKGFDIYRYNFVKAKM